MLDELLVRDTSAVVFIHRAVDRPHRHPDRRALPQHRHHACYVVFTACRLRGRGRRPMQRRRLQLRGRGAILQSSVPRQLPLRRFPVVRRRSRSIHCGNIGWGEKLGRRSCSPGRRGAGGAAGSSGKCCGSGWRFQQISHTMAGGQRGCQWWWREASAMHGRRCWPPKLRRRRIGRQGSVHRAARNGYPRRWGKVSPVGRTEQTASRPV